MKTYKTCDGKLLNTSVYKAQYLHMFISANVSNYNAAGHLSFSGMNVKHQLHDSIMCRLTVHFSSDFALEKYMC
jgi:hypothetical protein